MIALVYLNMNERLCLWNTAKTAPYCAKISNSRLWIWSSHCDGSKLHFNIIENLDIEVISLFEWNNFQIIFDRKLCLINIFSFLMIMLIYKQFHQRSWWIRMTYEKFFFPPILLYFFHILNLIFFLLKIIIIINSTFWK